jgi:hypothetical protein
VKGALFTALGTVLAAGAIVVVAYVWPSGEPKGALKDSELRWIGKYYAWEKGDGTCESVPTAPTDRLRLIARRARTACRGNGDWDAVQRAINARLFLRRPLPVSTTASSESHVNPPIARVASKIAGRDLRARCWSADDWARANREFTFIYPAEDYWAIGRAEPGGIVHFDGRMCRTLRRFFGSSWTPSRNIDRAELAEALVVLAHEAEHERDSTNSEAEVECYAIQHVRGLVRNEGRSKSFEDDIAAWAWELSYPRGDPVYATERCRNGGPLDLRPASNVWP